MSRRNYGQICSVATALDRIGERWSLLIVRELLLGPLRFTDLARYVGGAPTDVLSRRLRDLEADGIVSRRDLAAPASGTVYELTELGQQLEHPMLALGRWGIAFFDPTDLLTLEPHMLPHMVRFLIVPPERAELSVAVLTGDSNFNLSLEAGGLTVTRGEPPRTPDLTLTGAPREILWLFADGMRPGPDREAATALISSARGHDGAPEVEVEGQPAPVEALLGMVALPEGLPLPVSDPQPASDLAPTARTA